MSKTETVLAGALLVGGVGLGGELTPLLEDTEFETDRVDLSLAELDQPDLVVDHAHDDGARILMRVE